MKKIFILVLSTLVLAACASQRPNGASNYQSDLVYPRETANFVFQDLYVFDEPLLGTVLSYVDRQYPQDIISVYVYPIPATEWEDLEETLDYEMDRVIEEIDYSVKTGRYRSRTAEVREPFAVSEDGNEYVGLKASLDLVLENDQRLDSNAYLFISQDKFIKFRTSFIANDNTEINGDKIVREILPGIVVPPESDYMKKVREQHKKEQEAQLMNALIRALQNPKNTDNAGEQTESAE